MFDVGVSEEAVAYARDLVAQHNFGHRRGANGNQEQQLTGMIGQTVVHDLFGIPRPVFKRRWDGGVDFVFAGWTVDVKTMGRNVRPLPDYVNSLFKVQLQFPAAILLFCSFNKRVRVLTVCGWVTKNEFLNRAILYRRGTERVRGDGSRFHTKANQYEIRNSDLNSTNSLPELKAALSGTESRRGTVRPSPRSQE